MIYWFRTDLRLRDNPAFRVACARAPWLLPVYCHDPRLDQTTRWGTPRMDNHRRHFLSATLADLDTQLQARGSRLLQIQGAAAEAIPQLARALGVPEVVCEDIAAPEEREDVAGLRAAGLTVTSFWQSSLLAPETLPFPVDRLPQVYTVFRQSVENHGVLPPAPEPIPERMPPLPALGNVVPANVPPLEPPSSDPRSSFPYTTEEFNGGETAALAHLARYFSSDRPHRYKETRNGLIGTEYSSKFSPWLATGAISARTVYEALKRFESGNGANAGTYWLWFELLWRDYFRFLQLQHGTRLYRPEGLSQAPKPPHDPAAFQRWCQGRTGEPLVDAGMRELAGTGFLSNRMRQIVASALLHELACDWRAGAAWFEAQLIDYDPANNQGNWLSLAGRGTDPRGGRRFNLQKQAQEHDPDGAYRRLWGTGREEGVS